MSLIKQEDNKFKSFEGYRETIFYKISDLEYYNGLKKLDKKLGSFVSQ